MRKVMTLVGTRPELIKMSLVIEELDRHTQHVLVHSGQNFDYELNQVFFDDLGIRRPDHFLGAAGGTYAETIASVITKMDALLVAERPEALLLYGDTNTGIAVIAAKRRQIPVFHMEAGNRCFDQRVPEELNRKVLDHLSDINMVLTEHARRYLIAEGIRPETIIKTGSHMAEVFERYRSRIDASDVLERLKLTPGKYFLVSVHREENVDSPANLAALMQTLVALADTYGHPVIVSTHPRTRKRLEENGGAVNHPLIQFLKPFGFTEYVKLELEAFCICSDSGSVTEEGSLLSLPIVNLRSAHERPEGMDVGTAIMAGQSAAAVLDAVRVTTAQHDRSNRVFPVVEDYQSGPVSKQVLRVVLSYIDYVNRTVWFRT